jgi:hypothetical protein
MKVPGSRTPGNFYVLTSHKIEKAELMKYVKRTRIFPFEINTTEGIIPINKVRLRLRFFFPHLDYLFKYNSQEIIMICSRKGVKENKFL